MTLKHYISGQKRVGERPGFWEFRFGGQANGTMGIECARLWSEFGKHECQSPALASTRLLEGFASPQVVAVTG